MPGGGVTDTTCAHVRHVTMALSSITMLLSAPMLIFGGLIMDYFYHVNSFSVVSQWFSYMPTSLYMCSIINICSSILVFLPFICISGISRIFGMLTLGAVYMVSGRQDSEYFKN